MNVLLIGSGGRESAIARAISAHAQLHSIAGHANPSLVTYCRQSGGGLRVGNPCDGAAAAAYAREVRADLVVVSADDPLAAGVVDHTLAAGIPTIGPTREGAEIEWNKAYSRLLLEAHCPEANPRFVIARSGAEVERAVASFGDVPVAVKPAGLTGGKGVKVMGLQLETHADAIAYARDALDDASRHSSVLIEERLDGIEFTIQAMTDGQHVVFPPVTYDHPARFDGDRGPGTGGMGSFCDATSVPTFLPKPAYDSACGIITTVVRALMHEGRRFSGVLNGGFFATRRGVRVVEFNARFGDPEAINIMDILATEATEVLADIAAGRLDAARTKFHERASTVVYLVAPEYPSKASSSTRFELDVGRAEDMGARVHFGSVVEVGPGTFATIGSSRACALSATGSSIADAASVVYDAIGESLRSQSLEFRHDIGTLAALTNLENRARSNGLC